MFAETEYAVLGNYYPLYSSHSSSAGFQLSISPSLSLSLSRVSLRNISFVWMFVVAYWYYIYMYNMYTLAKSVRMEIDWMGMGVLFLLVQ